MQPSKKTAYDGMKTLYNFSRSAFNPFDEMSSEYLCFINNGKLIPLRTEVSKAMRKLGSNGQVLYETFVQEGLKTNTTPFTATIHKKKTIYFWPIKRGKQMPYQPSKLALLYYYLPYN